MTLAEFALLAGAGGLGAGARYIVDGLVMRGRKDAFPLGIFVANVTGSFLLALLTGMSALIGPAWFAILGTGLLGGYTTFSTVSTETVLLLQNGRRSWAWMNIGATLPDSASAGM